MFSGLDLYKNYSSENHVNEINNTLTNILDDFEYIEEESTDVEYRSYVRDIVNKYIN